jgi:hypothetical protein
LASLNIERPTASDPYHFCPTFPFSAGIGGHTLLLKRHTTIAPATCGKSPFTRGSHLLSFQDALIAFGQRSLQILAGESVISIKVFILTAASHSWMSAPAVSVLF